MKKKKDSYFGYKLTTSFLRFIGSIWFNTKVIGKENIPIEGRCILAGNHLSYVDAYFLFKATKRPIHFLGKIELFQGPFKWFFQMMHLIPVDRSKKNPEAIKKATELLEKEKVIGIFPEGTFHKKTLLLPFKPGAIHLAEVTGAPIIPFAIKSNFKFRSKSTITFGKPLYVDKINAEDKVEYLENIIKKMLED